MPTLIEMQGLTKHYGGSRGIIDLTCEVAEGEVFGFLGPNGAGKTTTMRLLMGLLRPSAGSVMTSPSRLTLPSPVHRSSRS